MTCNAITRLVQVSFDYVISNSILSSTHLACHPVYVLLLRLYTASELLYQQILCSTALGQQIDIHKPTLFLPETEDSWETICHGISSLSAICRNGAFEFAIDLIPIIQSISRPLTNAMYSERTRLSGAATQLVSVLASELGSGFDPLVPIFLPALLTLCSRTNKVVVTRSRTCIFTLIEATQLPSILSYFLPSIKEKSVSLRLVAAEGTLMCMNCFNPPDLEKETRAREIEVIIRATARDAHADVRKVGKKLFEAYKLILPSRIERYVGAQDVRHGSLFVYSSFTNPLTPTIKKYLDIKNVAITSQPTLARLTSTMKVTSQLSSSTSVLSSSSVASKTSNPQAHTKSASSTSSSNTQSKHGKSTRHGPLAVSDLHMPPPQYVPVRPTQSLNTALPASRLTSSLSSNQRTAFDSSHSGAGAVQSGLPVRPNSATGRPEGVRRPQCANGVSKISQEISIAGPRRVPLPVVNFQESDMSKSNRGAGSALTRPAPSHLQLGVGSAPIKRAEKSKLLPQPDSGSNPATTIPLSPTRPSRSVSQPTLSQLSRAIATHKPTEKASLKPTWGQSKRCRTKPLTKSTAKQQTRTGHKTNEGQPAPRSITPCQVPLPPSPSHQAPHPVAMQRSDHITLSIHCSCDPSPASPEPSTKTPAQTVQNEEVSIRATSTTYSGSSSPSHPGDADRKHTLQIPPEVSDGRDLKTTPPNDAPKSMDISATPISALLNSIQNGFLLTPSSPLSPPQSYTYGHSSSLEGEGDIGTRVTPCMDNQAMLPPRKLFMFGIAGEPMTSML
jgi:hypothetical protein